MPIGGVLYEGGSKLFSGPLGIVQIAFEGYDLGKTTADTTLVPDQDIKDIMYQQDGSKPADHVRTGQEYVLNATFGEIKTGLLKLLMAGITSVEDSGEDSAILEREMFGSMRTDEAGPLKVASVDENGLPSSDLEDILNFYEVIPIIAADLINWGADTQRNLPVEFRIKWYEFPAAPGSLLGAFGYVGDPSIETEAYDIANIWPNVAGPIIVSAEAIDATDLELIFNESLVFAGGAVFAAADYMVKVYKAVEDIEFLVPASGVIATVKLTLTFAASTFETGDVVAFYMTGDALEDAVPNAADALDAYPVTNDL